MNTHTPLRLRRLEIDTFESAVVCMNRDCHVCRAEGFEAQSRVRVAPGLQALEWLGAAGAARVVRGLSLS